jgi:hypothetical protein
MRTNGSGTKAQLIFSDSDFGSTGKLFNLRQAGVDKFVVDANGTFVTAAMPATLVTNTPAVVSRRRRRRRRSTSLTRRRRSRSRRRPSRRPRIRLPPPIMCLSMRRLPV